MWKFLTILAFIAAASATPAVRHRYEENAMRATAGRQPGRIVGGVNARIEDHPYQVALFYNSRFTCGGAVYNPTTVISAAHCTHGRVTTLFHVLPGQTENTVYDDLVVVSQVIQHPQYNDFTLYADIVVLRLASSLVYSDRVQPVVLPPPNFIVTPDTPSSLSGWGTMEWGTSQFPTTLQNVIVPTWTQQRCIDIYPEEEIFDSNVCAGEPGRDACQGDSGGPLIYRGFFVGIVSWGYGCAFEWPTVYCRVSSFLEFIINNSN